MATEYLITIYNTFLFFFFSFCKIQQDDSSYHYSTPLLLKTCSQTRHALQVENNRAFPKQMTLLALRQKCRNARSLYEKINNFRYKDSSEIKLFPNTSSFQSSKDYQMKITIIHQKFGNLFCMKRKLFIHN